MTETKTRSDADRRQQIAQAASEVFIRYGLARTTMSDIAAAAGISRPTLYASFLQKRDVFGAVIDLIVSRKLAQLAEEIPREPDLASKLRRVCLSWALEGFDLVRANPDARDMFDISFEPVRRSHIVFGRMVSEVLADAGRAEPDLTGQMMVAAIRGFKELADDREILCNMIVRLCDAVAAS
ncbi:hypothetical protein K32_22800 [Kaistia sp. 32K]|uniref:TetR/AcrR family transcriptional regulator n=1 Tax=Kaistia sp. 32K TaxID=2795690 RepID=UPI00191604C1|nr:helix-turn-helix domain-containing protein [Kaistia sp. 32K]BCP53663.1 hypothetical protein K32_22800 [Kaistia sp. 32K]